MINQPYIQVNHLDYDLPNGKSLFKDISINFSDHKIGLIGRNGSGKTTLVRLIIGELLPSLGNIYVNARIAYVPQNPSFEMDITVGDFLNCDACISDLKSNQQNIINNENIKIIDNNRNKKNYTISQLKEFEVDKIPDSSLINKLSGGEITRILLTKAFFSDANYLILDEPTNHLDYDARQILNENIRQWHGGILLISHDRNLLNIMDEIVEITTLGLNRYGGNYSCYKQQKQNEVKSNKQRLLDAKKALKKTKHSIQNAKEKHAQRRSQGKKLRSTTSQAEIILDFMRSRSTKSLGEISTRHRRMLNDAEKKLAFAKKKIEIINEININLPNTYVPKGKIILKIENISFSYSNKLPSIIKDFSYILRGPERIKLEGKNGSGKTTLIKLILGELKPQYGNIYLGTKSVKYLDQNTNLLNPKLSILDNFLYFNPDISLINAYRSLAGFLFKNNQVLKLAGDLSSGEKLKALLACILMSKNPPQLLILDEPTNHLDIHSIKNIEEILNCYQGSLILISHDIYFLNSINITKTISPPFTGNFSSINDKFI